MGRGADNVKSRVTRSGETAATNRRVEARPTSPYHLLSLLSLRHTARTRAPPARLPAHGGGGGGGGGGLAEKRGKQWSSSSLWFRLDQTFCLPPPTTLLLPHGTSHDVLLEISPLTDVSSPMDVTPPLTPPSSSCGTGSSCRGVGGSAGSAGPGPSALTSHNAAVWCFCSHTQSASSS